MRKLVPCKIWSISIFILLFMVGSFVYAYTYHYDGHEKLKKVDMDPDNGAEVVEECFTDVCDGCQTKHMQITSAARRENRIVVRATIDYKVSALLGTSNYKKDWRIELYDDIDRYKCVSAEMR